MFLSLITLFVALSLSVIAAYYSIAGLTAIFAAAVIPIMVMGSILELAKVVVTLWLHEYWSRARWLMKLYLVPAVLMLMVITSMGIFGFLSKAHSDQNLVSGDVQAKIVIYDEKIRTEKENIEANRKALKQMDEGVDSVLGRSTTETGAEKAVAMRKSQQKERTRLQNEILQSQKSIAELNNARAPIAAEVRKVEAEVGPIKYIAALIYGDNPDTNVLERAVRWVIILLVCVFDPLAIMLLLAASESLKWAREKAKDDEEKEDILEDGYKTPWPDRPPIPGYDDEYVKWPGGVGIPEPVAEKEFDIKDHPYLFTPAGSDTPPGIEPAPIQVYRPEPSDPELEPCYKCGTPLLNAPGIGPFCPNRNCDVGDGPFLRDKEKLEIVLSGILANDEEIDEDDPRIKARIKRWKLDHPADTLKNQRIRFRMGIIKQLPWMEYPDSSFGTVFPTDAKRGDTFVRIDVQPTVVYKFNGQDWMEVDKNVTDSYTYDDAYINYLIEKIDHGEYDPDLLSDSERDQVAEQLKKQTNEK
jgi:hypothetical protein